jgi:hypothetical protein
MSPEHFHPGTRKIARIGVETPILVPSFSSRGFPAVDALYESLRNDLYGVCLVSAFDVFTRRLAVELSDLADLVLLDSGVYETKPVAVAIDGYHPPATNDEWARDSYHQCLGTVRPDANVVAVSFDHYGPIEEQVKLAVEDFSHAPTAASDFLLKPVSADAIVDAAAVRACASQLSQFQVLGVTEQELGYSLLQRCRTLIALRVALTEVGLRMPIHVFGTITPGAVLAYFLSGSDIFDGLNWLRFAYGLHGLEPIAETVLEEGAWDQPDEARFLQHAIQNLRFLSRLQDEMRSYCRTGDFQSLTDAVPVAERAARAAAAAGALFPGMRIS